MNELRCPTCNHFVCPTYHGQLTPVTVWQRLAHEIRTDALPRGARIPSQRGITITEVYARISSGLSDIDRRIFARVMKKLDQPTRMRILTDHQHVWFDTHVVDPDDLPEGESVQPVTVEYRLRIGPSPGYVQVVDTGMVNAYYTVKKTNLQV